MYEEIDAKFAKQDRRNAIDAVVEAFLSDGRVAASQDLTALVNAYAGSPLEAVFSGLRQKQLRTIVSAAINAMRKDGAVRVRGTGRTRQISLKSPPNWLRGRVKQIKAARTKARKQSLAQLANGQPQPLGDHVAALAQALNAELELPFVGIGEAVPEFGLAYQVVQDLIAEKQCVAKSVDDPDGGGQVVELRLVQTGDATAKNRTSKNAEAGRVGGAVGPAGSNGVGGGRNEQAAGGNEVGVSLEMRRVTDLKPHPENKKIYGDRPDAEFVQSITEQGVLQPLLITFDNRIISGHGRHYGAEKAGRADVPVVVFNSRDELDILEALVVCNKQRQKTNEQFAREAQALRRIEQERARKRQKELAGRHTKAAEVPVKLPEGDDTGDARDKVGRQLGTSGKKAEQAAVVADAIDRLTRDKRVREAKQLRTKLNTGSVHSAYQFASKQGMLDRPAAAASRIELTVVGESYITLARWKKMSAKDRRAVLENVAANSKAGFNFQEFNSIEWALWSWNPVTGCRHNCPYCYARDIANRRYKQKFEPSIYPARLKAPHNVAVPKEATKEIGYRNVFTCSMADLFGRWVPKEWIEAVLAEVRAAPQWNFLFLTKFPKRLTEFAFPDNAWVGTTVDCQARVENAEAAFRKVKAAVKWLSCEPLLEPLQFTDLRMFNWLVLGGSSKSTQTPEFHPPRYWVNAIQAAARKAGCRIYEKDNLLDRIREYPGAEDRAATEAPKVLRYLPCNKG